MVIKLTIYVRYIILFIENGNHLKSNLSIATQHFRMKENEVTEEMADVLWMEGCQLDQKIEQQVSRVKKKSQLLSQEHCTLTPQSRSPVPSTRCLMPRVLCPDPLTRA